MYEVICLRGSVFKSGKSWLYQFDVGKDSDGNRIRQSQRFPTKEEAEKALLLRKNSYDRYNESTQLRG